MKWRAQRRVVDFPTSVSSDRNSVLLNASSISASGAKLEGIHALKKGDEICITCLADRISARVVWAAHEECGINFTRPLEKRQLAYFRKPGGTGFAVWNLSGSSSNMHGFHELWAIHLGVRWINVVRWDFWSFAAYCSLSVKLGILQNGFQKVGILNGHFGE